MGDSEKTKHISEETNHTDDKNPDSINGGNFIEISIEIFLIQWNILRLDIKETFCLQLDVLETRFSAEMLKSISNFLFPITVIVIYSTMLTRHCYIDFRIVFKKIFSKSQFLDRTCMFYISKMVYRRQFVDLKCFKIKKFWTLFRIQNF